MAVVSPGRASKVIVAQHRLLGAGVAERDASQLDVAALRRCRGVGGIRDGRLGVQDLADAARRRRRLGGP